jgi:hypothetical protein
MIAEVDAPLNPRFARFQVIDHRFRSSILTCFQENLSHIKRCNLRIITLKKSNILFLLT